MEKPVNVMTYDMRDFLVSCVDRYCDLAKVQKQIAGKLSQHLSQRTE